MRRRDRKITPRSFPRFRLDAGNTYSFTWSNWWATWYPGAERRGCVFWPSDLSAKDERPRAARHTLVKVAHYALVRGHGYSRPWLARSITRASPRDRICSHVRDPNVSRSATWCMLAHSRRLFNDRNQLTGRILHRMISIAVIVLTETTALRHMRRSPPCIDDYFVL